MIKLDNRLQMLYNMVRSGSKIIDVGADHGYLISKIILDKKCPSGKCVDINLKCLEKAKKLASKYNLIDKINFSHSDGLEEISREEAEDIIIAGMGSELIIKITDKCQWLKEINNKYIIMQPMTKPWLLREYLYKNGFEILDEDITLSKKNFYIAILARFCGQNKQITDIDKLIGTLTNKKNKYVVDYLYMLSKKFESIFNNISTNGNDHDKYNYYKDIYNKINDVILNYTTE